MVTEFQKTFALSDMDRQILGFVREKPCTVADLALRLHRSMPSISSSLRRLMGLGWIVEDGVAQSTGGRRPRLYKLVKDVKWTLGIDIGRRSTRLVSIDLLGNVLDSHSFRSPDLQDNELVFGHIGGWVEEAIGRSGLDRKDCLGVGFAIPGLVDSTRGTTSTYLVTDRPLRDELSDIFGLPVFVVNDARAMAYGEYRQGVARGVQDVAVVNMGWGGTGMGIILDGRLHYGAHRHAGEFGHITVDPEGELCMCGKRGCLETICSGQAMVRRAVRSVRKGVRSQLYDMVDGQLDQVDTGVLVDAIRQGDTLAIDTLLETASTLGKGLAIVMTLFDPELIVIGGYVSAAGDILIDSLRATARASIIPQLIGEVNIVASELGDNAAAIGAARMVVDPLFIEKRTTAHSNGKQA